MTLNYAANNDDDEDDNVDAGPVLSCSVPVAVVVMVVGHNIFYNQ